MKRINGHGHILPEPNQIPKFMKDKKLFWIDDDKKIHATRKLVETNHGS